MRTFRHTLSLGLALGLSLSLACTDTPTVPAAPVDGPSFGKAPAESGAVVRFTVINGFILTDLDNGLQSTIGFDRARWCADGSPTPLRPYLTEIEVQRTTHSNGRITIVRSFEGILVVSDGRILNCGDPVIGFGSGTSESKSVSTPGPPVPGPGPPDLVSSGSWHGFITTADGSTKRVNVIFKRWRGFRGTDELIDLRRGKIILR